VDVEKARRAVVDLLIAIGVDEGDHTVETPGRVAKAWGEALSGYGEDPSRHLSKTFTAPTDPGLVVVSGIEFASTCAHHMLPITGTATVAYRPKRSSQVVGLSKLARVVEGYARRLQVQERLGFQVAAAVQARLTPQGAGCVITAEHGCMTVRGVRKTGALTTSTSFTGDWRSPDHPDVRTVLEEHRANLR
jgi:GTP cyclohydrolase I